MGNLHIHLNISTYQQEEHTNMDMIVNFLEAQGLVNGPEEMSWGQCALMGAVIIAGFDLMNRLVSPIGDLFCKTIPVRGKHLDSLSTTDIIYISFNKAALVPFVYFNLKLMYHEQNAVWSLQKCSVNNILLPIPIIFIVYDFFYTLLHWFLHIKGIYEHFHKHHHHQKAPSRATIDAVNVHPIEFFLGEYNHLLAIFISTRILGLQFHIVGLLIYLILSFVMAALNHTRFDSVVKVLGVTIFDSKYHDVHHRIPMSNFGQYMVLWDKLFGTFRDYDENDRVNPAAQLDPLTGKTKKAVS